MSRVSSKPARRALSGRAAHSPVAGFRPRAAVAAVAAAFSLQPLLLQAQPTGAHVIHGQASFSRSGSNLLVTTRNGAGTSHSAIDWQSFSIPAGSTTRFLQPSASSTSINRVVGPDPSAIFGTLSSNGRIVLVNPAGITVGRGAVVDTAGFTASTLAMGEADAMAGRLLFEGGSGGTLQVDGDIIARSGDIFLIGPKVRAGATATVQGDGTTVLAAGQKVALTGRGLEGIRMEVQAGNEVLNLGRLQGDAVGVFAGTLRHSGLIEAQAVSTEGGRVVLKAAGDALVDGSVRANAGDKGGSIDVLGQRVALEDGAALHASGRLGGGQVRVGGDFQGRNPDVPNAARTYVAAGATIDADATVQGDGGRVIVWADEITASYGAISARGGAEGGDGGFVEVSGKRQLAFRSSVDTSAPRGAMGTLLLDPDYINVVASSSSPGTLSQADTFSDASGSSIDILASDISASSANVILQANEDIQIDAAISMASQGAGLTAQAGGFLYVNAAVTTQGGDVKLVAGDPGSLTSPNEGALYVNAAITTNGGNVSLEAPISDVGGNSVYVDATVDAGSGLINVRGQRLDVAAAGSLNRSGAGDITLDVDGLNLLGQVRSVGGRVVLNPMTANQVGVALLGQGGFGLDGGFNIGNATLDQIEAKTLVVGRGSMTAPIFLSGDLTLAASRIQELSLISAGQISQSSGSLTVSGVNLDGRSVSVASAANAVGTVSGRFDEFFDFQSGASTLSVGTVDGIDGVQQRTASTTANPGITIASLGGALNVNADVKANDTEIWLQGTTVNLAGSAMIAASGPAGAVWIDATGTGSNNLGGGTIQAGSYVDIGGDGAFKLGNLKTGSLYLYSNAGATVVTQQGGTSIEAASLYASLDAASGSRLELANTGNKIGELGGYVEGDVKVYSGLSMGIGYLQGANIDLQAGSIGMGVENGIYAYGNLKLSGTGSASTIDLRGGYVNAGGDLGFFNAGNAYLGSTYANTLTASLAGSLLQDSADYSELNIANGVSFNVGGSVSLLNNPYAYYPNMLGYVSGTAGGDIAIDGATGVAAAGLKAGGDIAVSGGSGSQPPALAFTQLAATALAMPTDLDVIGSVTAGGMATLKSDTAILVQDTATVSGTTIDLLAPTTTLNGVLQPGGAGGIGAVNVSGDLFVGNTGTIQMDVASLTSFDTLDVTGTATTDAATSLKVVDLSGGTLSGSFSPASVGSGSSLAFSVPAYWSVTPMSALSPYVITAGLAPAPAPAPAPLPALTEQEAAEQQLTSQVVQFASLFVEESERQEDEDAMGKDDIVFTDTACRPQ